MAMQLRSAGVKCQPLEPEGLVEIGVEREKQFSLIDRSAVPLRLEKTSPMYLTPRAKPRSASASLASAGADSSGGRLFAMERGRS